MNILPIPQPRFDPATTFETTELRDAAPLWWRRAVFAVPVLGAPVLGTWLAALATSGLSSPLRLPLLALVAVNLLYMAVTGWPSVLGVLLHLTRRTMTVVAAPSGQSRTALVMPVYNEDPQTVFAAMECMARAIADAGLTRIDLHVLSDTQDMAIAAAERAAYERALSRIPGTVALRYRRRVVNAGRKVGNLLDFCHGAGRFYDYMVVLDADSLMGPHAIGTLIGLMDANPATGIIQTVPYPVGRETLFARIMQFSARVYSPLLVQGLTYWQQGDGNYWGHNAIVRIAPFVAHCALPVLPGREPLGGEILCHDVVEAGLMRAAGWGVWVLPDSVESFEALPANMVDFMGRERRWCQGNLQHMGVLPDRRLRPVGRFHLAYGVLHYLAAPAAVSFLLLATIDAICGGGVASALLRDGGAAKTALVALSLFLLYAGKVLTLATVAVSAERARPYGGRLRLLASAALEQIAACIVSAVLIVSYTRSVASVLMGRSVRWDPQPRDDRGMSWAEAWRNLRVPVLLGGIWLLALSRIDAGLLFWATPLLAGLLAALPAMVLSSRAGLGRAARRLGLFLTPDESAPPPVLRAYQRAAAGEQVVARPRGGMAPLHLATPAADA